MDPGEAVVLVAGADATPASSLEGVRARMVDGVSAACSAVREGNVDCILVGAGLEGTTPTDVLRAVRDVDAGVPVVLWPADVEAGAARDAVRHDATEYLPDADAGAVAEHVRTVLETGDETTDLRRLRAAVEAVHDHVFALDEEARVTMVTDALADRVGREESDIRGESLAALLSSTGARRGIELVDDLLAGTTGDAASYETELDPLDGDTAPVEVELSLLEGHGDFDGVVGVVRDRTEIERTRRELETARERFRYLFEHIPDAVVEAEAVDGEPVVRSVNPAFEEVFGYDPDEVVGSSLDDYVLTEELREEGTATDRRAFAGEEVVEQVRRKTADGVRDFLLRSVPYRVEDDTVRGFAIYTDVTERTERERRLRVLTNILRHNLRTEMNLVLGTAEEVLAEDPGDRVAELVGELRESAETVVDMGETARDIEALVERTWGTDQSVDLSRLADDVAWRLQRAHPEATVETDLPETARVCGDEAIERAVHELLENAIVHHDGEPTVEVTVEQRDEEWVELRVADDGPGIPTVERELVSGERDVSQLQHGSGLGLWIARWTAESLDGSLALLDREPTGTVARLRLRAA